VKILWFSDFLIPTGIGRVSHHLVRGLIKKGIEVAVATPYMGGKPLVIDNVRIYPMLQFDQALFSRIVCEYEPDLTVCYITHHQLPYNQLSKILSELGIKILWYNPVEWDEISPTYVAPYIGANMIAVATETGKRVLSEFLPEDFITIVSHGVDPEVFYVENPKPKFREFRDLFIYGMVGKNVMRKSFPELIEAFVKLPAEVKEKSGLYLHTTKVSTAGEVVYWNLDWLVMKHGLSGKVFMPEFVTMWWGEEDDMLRKLYNAMSCYCQISLSEGFGLPIIEAMACGVPVIASANTSVPEVVGDAGLLVECWEEPIYHHDGWAVHKVKINALAAAMLEIYQNEGLRKTLIKRGMERAREFTWEKATLQMASAIEKAYKHHRLRSNHIKAREPIGGAI